MTIDIQAALLNPLLVFSSGHINDSGWSSEDRLQFIKKINGCFQRQETGKESYPRHVQKTAIKYCDQRRSGFFGTDQLVVQNLTDQCRLSYCLLKIENWRLRGVLKKYFTPPCDLALVKETVKFFSRIYSNQATPPIQFEENFLAIPKLDLKAILPMLSQLRSEEVQEVFFYISQMPKYSADLLRYLIGTKLTGKELLSFLFFFIRISALDFNAANALDGIVRDNPRALGAVLIGLQECEARSQTEVLHKLHPFLRKFDPLDICPLIRAYLDLPEENRIELFVLVHSFCQKFATPKQTIHLLEKIKHQSQMIIQIAIDLAMGIYETTRNPEDLLYVFKEMVEEPFEVKQEILNSVLSITFLMDDNKAVFLIFKVLSFIGNTKREEVLHFYKEATRQYPSRKNIFQLFDKIKLLAFTHPNLLGEIETLTKKYNCQSFFERFVVGCYREAIEKENAHLGEFLLNSISVNFEVFTDYRDRVWILEYFFNDPISAFLGACEDGSPELISWFLSRDIKLTEPLNKIRLYEKFLSMGITQNTTLSIGYFALMSAIYFNRHEVIKILLSAGIAEGEFDIYGTTPQQWVSGQRGRSFPAELKKKIMDLSNGVNEELVSLKFLAHSFSLDMSTQLNDRDIVLKRFDQGALYSYFLKHMENIHENLKGDLLKNVNVYLDKRRLDGILDEVKVIMQKAIVVHGNQNVETYIQNERHRAFILRWVDHTVTVFLTEENNAMGMPELKLTRINKGAGSVNQPAINTYTVKHRQGILEFLKKANEPITMQQFYEGMNELLDLSSCKSMRLTPQKVGNCTLASTRGLWFVVLQQMIRERLGREEKIILNIARALKRRFTFEMRLRSLCNYLDLHQSIERNPIPPNIAFLRTLYHRKTKNSRNDHGFILEMQRHITEWARQQKNLSKDDYTTLGVSHP